MNEPTYGREIFRCILSRMPSQDRDDAMRWHIEKEAGIYVRSIDEPPPDDLPPAELDTVTWHPYRDITIPALPFPFNARQFAAFCLPGPGSSILEAYVSGNNLNDRLEPVKREELDLARLGRNAASARELLLAAHALLLRMPGEQEHTWRSRHDIDLESEDAQIRWLLTNAAPPQQLTAPGVPTGDMANALSTLGSLKSKRNSDQWAKLLGGSPKWAASALITKGNAPAPSTWNPVELTLCLLARVQPDSDPALASPMFNRPELKAWRDAWLERINLGS